MNSSRKTDHIKNDNVISAISNKACQGLTCKLDEILVKLNAIPLVDGKITQGTKVSSINVYDKNGVVVGSVDYVFKYTNSASRKEAKAGIAETIQTNIPSKITTTKRDVEKALDATADKNFGSGDKLTGIALTYENKKIGSIDYTFVNDNDLRYKPSKKRKEVIEYIVKTVNEKYPKKYETTYEKVDEILPEQSNGKDKGDQQTKLDIPLYKIEEKYEKVDAGGLLDKVYLVVKTEAPLGYKHKVKIYEKESLLEEAGTALPISNSKVCSVFNTDYASTKVTSLGQGEAIAEVTLRPDNEILLQDWRKKFKPAEAQAEIVDKLYLKVDDKDEFLKGGEFELRGASCFCGRDFTVDEVKSIVKELRKSESISSTTLFSDSRSPLQEPDRTYERFTEELNRSFSKYDINTCLRKAHFLAQAYHETDRFRTTIEYSSGTKYNPGQHPDAETYGNTTIGDGPKYRGRGLMQLTWKNN